MSALAPDLGHEALDLDDEQRRALIATLLEHGADGVSVVVHGGPTWTNAAGLALVGTTGVMTLEERLAWQGSVCFFRPGDRDSPLPVEELPPARALRGSELAEETLFVVTRTHPEGRLVSASARPLPGGVAVVVYRDVTEPMVLAEDLSRTTDALAESRMETRVLLDQLRAATEDLPTPVLELDSGIVLAPLVGPVDAVRIARLSESLGIEVIARDARVAVVDLSAAQLGDPAFTDHLGSLLRCLERLGCRGVVSGVPAEGARAFVALQPELGRHWFARSVRDAVRLARRAEGARHPSP